MADELERRQTIDPATAEILGNLEQKRAESQLPRDERKKKIKEREKAQSRLPRRVNWDLPVKLKQKIVTLADEQRIPASQIAAFLLSEGLGLLEAGTIDLDRHKEPSDSPRYEWNLRLPGAE